VKDIAVALLQLDPAARPDISWVCEQAYIREAPMEPNDQITGELASILSLE
jgi:hypothetical protein